jgi:hypothetical protein
VLAADLTLPQRGDTPATAAGLFDFQTCHLPPFTRHWQNLRHENIYPTDYNSISDVDRSSLVCANNRFIARYRNRLFGSFKRPAESAGDDETNDGDVEVE